MMRLEVLVVGAMRSSAGYLIPSRTSAQIRRVPQSRHPRLLKALGTDDVEQLGNPEFGNEGSIVLPPRLAEALGLTSARIAPHPLRPCRQASGRFRATKMAFEDLRSCARCALTDANYRFSSVIGHPRGFNGISSFEPLGKLEYCRA
jgi:hypothetical protein